MITGRPHPSLSPAVDQHVSGFQNAQEEKATTGGTGFIGSCLAKMILDEDLDVATFDIKPTSSVLEPYGSRWRHFRGDLRDMSEVMTVIKESQPEVIYHLGGMLSTPSKENPQASFMTNVVGMFNVLESARLLGINMVVYASPNGTFGLDLEGLTVIDDRTLQRPFTMYGCGKLFGELLGRYYHRKYGIDFRSVRLPAVVGPGAQTKNVSVYNAWALERSLFGEPYEIFVTAETRAPIIYFKDAARAFLEISRPPADRITTMNYVLAGVDAMPSAGELKDTILPHLPQAQLTFNPDPLAMAFQKMHQGVRWDETPAVREWNWKVKYNLDDMVEDFIRELTDHRSWYI